MSEENPNEHSSDQGQGNEAQKFPSLNRNSIGKLGFLGVLRIIIEAGIAWWFWLLAGFYDITSRQLLVNIFLFIGSAALLADIAHKISVHWPRKRVIWIVYLLILAAMLVSKYEQIKSPPAPEAEISKQPPSATPSAFFAKYTWYQSAGPDTPTLWYVRGTTARPVYLALILNFTNLQSAPVLIDSYAVEEQSDDGGWQTASITLVDNQGAFYSGADPKMMKEFQYTTFDSVIANRNIGPHETVRGWVFLDSFFSKGKMFHGIRLKISDSFGNLFTEPLVGNIGQPAGWMVQPLMNSDAGKPPRDISNLINQKH